MWSLVHPPILRQADVPESERPVIGGGWRECGAKSLTPYVLAVLGTERERLETGRVEPGTVAYRTSLERYVHHLMATLEWFEASVDHRHLTHPLRFGWKDEAGEYSVTCVRAELMLMTTLWVTELLQSDETRDWQEAVRLCRAVCLPQLNAWPKRAKGDFPLATNENSQRELLCLCILRLQLFSITAWEERGADGKLGARLCLWAVVHARRLSIHNPKFTAVADEIEGVMWLYNMHSDYDSAQELLRCARVRFEALGMSKRVEQVTAKLGLSSAGGDVNKARSLMTHIKSFSFAKGHRPLLRPVVVPESIRSSVFGTASSR